MKSTRQDVLVDTSCIYALFVRSDRNHLAARNMPSANLRFVTIESAIAEAWYLIRTRSYHRRAVGFLEGVATIRRETLQDADLRRAREIMQKYADAEFDFVDSCLMALSERLEITTNLTFDRRDFSLFRPSHAEHLTLLP